MLPVASATSRVLLPVIHKCGMTSFANKKAILNAVDGFEAQLAIIRKLIEDEDSQALMGLLEHAQAARQHFNHMLARKPLMEKIK